MRRSGLRFSRRTFRRRAAFVVVALMFLDFLLMPVSAQTERSMSGTITVTSGIDVFNISSTKGQTLSVVANWILTFSVFHCNWTMMNGTKGSAMPNVTVKVWMNRSGGTRDSADNNQTHYAFAYRTNDSSLGKAGCNGWYEVGPDAATDSHLVSVTNTSNITLTTVGNDPVMVHYTLTFKFNPDARYANSTGSITGAWFLSVAAKDNESNVDYYDNATAHYNQFYALLSVNDTTWAKACIRGSSISNESEVHRLKYTANFFCDLQGRGDVFNHTTGYGANKYIRPDNISIAWCTGGSTVLSSAVYTWTNFTWFWTNATWNSTRDIRHRVDLSGVPGTLTLGNYNGNTYVRLRQH